MLQSEQPLEVMSLDSDDPELRGQVERLFQRVVQATGHPALSEAGVLSFPSGAGSVGRVARRGGALTGYGQLDWRGSSTEIEVVVDPEEPEPPAVRTGLLEALVAQASQDGATAIRYWVMQHRDPAGTEATDLGFSVDRDLLQLRVPLPLEVTRPVLDPRFTIRSFRPGQDEAAWLEVNNRAFALHPEQGGWDLDNLVARERTGWFDPAGFLLCETDGRLAGSCWTKVHADHSPVLGEIYVISVDPDFQSLGLGRALAVAGLDRLSERAPVGMLYVDASNAGAVALYTQLGFHVDHLDRCYRLEPATDRGRPEAR